MSIDNRFSVTFVNLFIAMEHPLCTYFKERKIENLTAEEYGYYAALFQPKKMKKGAFLLREGEVCKYLAFVVKGCLRQYAIDNKGKEHIMQFAPENWWISDMESASNGTPINRDESATLIKQRYPEFY